MSISKLQIWCIMELVANTQNKKFALAFLSFFRPPPQKSFEKGKGKFCFAVAVALAEAMARRVTTERGAED